MNDFEKNMYQEIRMLREKFSIMKLENTKLKNQLRWRPTIEKPKEGQIVFAMIQTGWVVAQYLNGKFYTEDGFTFGDLITGVTHWLPIPPLKSSATSTTIRNYCNDRLVH